MDRIETPYGGSEPETVAALLRQHAEHRPDALAYRFLTTTGEESWTYCELDRRARTVAAHLQRENLRGRPVLLLHPPGLEYVANFLGCLYAGAIAVPAYPPDTGRFGQTLPRLAAIARDSRATHALTTGDLSGVAESRHAEIAGLGLGELRWLATDRFEDAAEEWRDPGSTGGTLAFLQYTSGSTSTPKGVMVSNDNLLANLRAIHLRLEHDRDSVLVSWLPPYHDMGLIGGVLTPLYGGFPAHLMAPMTFVQRPMLWLETISTTRASTAIAPNFGFDYCLRRITPEQRDTLDLRHWRLALNGAEPVRADTLDRFADHFAPCGFDRRALSPCYGLAEATLIVSGVRAGDRPAVTALAAASLEAGSAEPARDGERTARVVGCGPAADGVGVAIVDPRTGRRVRDGRVGEIWVIGPSVARGYWRRPEDTRETFHATLDGEDGTRYLRTGDLGFERDGELYVAGRTKDVVIVQGRNHYPQDVELTVERAGDVIRANCGAAFGIPVDGAEELVVAYEVDGRLLKDADALLARLRTAIAEEHEVSPHAVVLLKRSSVRKTTSGKIQRQACREAFLGFALPVVAASVVREFDELSPAESPSRAKVTAAVADVLGGAAGDFADLGVGYPQLLDAVRTLERRFGTRLPIGPLLADPRADTLVTLLAGGEPAAEPERASPEPDVPDTEERSGTEIEAWLVTRIAGRLGLRPSTIDVTQPFATLGLDSKKAVTILEELGAWLGRELTPGLLFDHPTVRDLAANLTANPAANLAGPRTGPAASSTGTATEEPIAVVGLGCRFPGAPDVDGYWRLLLDGRDAITEVPADRWDADGVNAPRFGGFVDHVGDFDARFFGISAREAERMDPQQRVLLEVAWLTLEDAGIAPDRVAGTDTGVFVGISSHDYSALQLGDLDAIDVHAATGNAHSVAANRLSYVFDLTGPSLAVDTACSSSLTAIHMACRSLRAGECRMALAGGVNLLLTPALSVAFAAGQMLAADGRCRTFDDAASGYVRGEGAGLACLKPLSAAIEDGDRIYAVVTGSGLGHGGRSNGLTAPKGSAQRAVIERALGQAGLRGDQVDYVEAHGTGTSLGDPIEWEALAGVYGRSRRPDTPCLVGSAKSNIGHLEAAAGIAGFIKAALVVHHRQVPPQLHLKTPNRHLDWDGSGLEVPVRGRALPAHDVTRAGVSSFGFGGMNAHAVLETAPAPQAVAPSERPAYALCLSAHTPTALMTLARQYRAHLAAYPDTPLGDLCHVASTGRARLAHRAVVIGGSAGEADASLEALMRGEPAKTVLRGQVSGNAAPRPAFLFSGQGTQYAGMGKAIYEAHPGFARTLDRADAVLRPLLGVSLLDLLFDEGGADRLRRTRYCQPALVAFEIALAELWISLGVRPAAVLGHSVGAFGAACVAGVLGLEDALTLAATRGEHMDAQPGDGAMIACVGDAGTTRAAAESAGVAVAAVNTPDHLVLSGPAARIRAAREDLEARGVRVRPLTVSHAFHSDLMTGAAEPLREAAGAVAFGTPELPWVSDATGEPVERVDAGYWVGHMLGTVRFADGFATLRRLGCDAFVEIGPHPTLLNLARAMTTEGETPLWLPSLRRGGRDWETFLQSLGRLHCAGGDVDWPALDAGARRVRVPVPHAVFERQPYWFAAPSADRAPAMDVNGGQRMEIAVNSNGSHPAGATAQNGAAPNGHGAPSGGALTHVTAQVARVCGFPVDQIPADARVGSDLGLDSLMKAELERLLAARYPDRVAGLRERLPEDFTVGELTAALGDVGTPAVPHPAPQPPPQPPQPQAYGQQQPMAYPPPYGPMGYWSPQPMPYAPVPYGPPQYGPPQYAPQQPPPQQPPPPPAPAPAEEEKPTVKRELEFEGWEEHDELQGRIRQIESSGANAYGRVHEGFNSARISMDGRPVINFSAFNYLALSAHPRLRAAAKAAIDRYGTSSSATPLLCGETPLHHELDDEIAGFLGTEAAIVFAGGHATNVATVGHLFGPEDLILHDEWIHDSTVRGCILSGAKRRPFPHNDWAALDKVLTAMRDQYRRAVVVIEGAYSQDGDIPDLPRFIEVKKRHDAMLMIDEAHSIGVLGRTGRGIGEHWGVDRRDVDLWMGTLSKALGSLGGYIAARQPIIQYLKFTAPLFIFSTGISPANTAAALEAFRVIRDEPERVARVQELSDFFRAAARARGLDTGVSRATAVIPIILGSWERAMTVSNELLAQGVNVMPIGYPAVARDKCRLRFFINVDHREEDLEHSLDLLGQAMGTTPKQHDDATAPGSTSRPARSGGRRGGADVLVAGASGFIGGHLTRRLVEHGHSVRVLVREGSDRSAFDDLPVDIEVGSLGDTESLRRATAGVRHVYNCTGKSADWGAWSEFEQVNVDGSRNLAEAAADAGTVERFLHVSTTDVYGYPVRPCDESAGLNDIGLPYNRSKVLGERAVTRAAERAGLPYTIVRPVSVYGPGSKDFVIEMATLLLQKQMVYVRKGRAPAGLLYVGNAADGMIAACTSDATAGRAYNLRDPEPTTWREYLEALAAGLGVKPPSISLPTALATGVASASEKVYGSLRVKSRPVLTRHAVHLLNRDQSYSIDRARDDFGFKSEVSFEEGMRHTIDWLNSAEGRRHVAR